MESVGSGLNEANLGSIDLDEAMSEEAIDRIVSYIFSIDVALQRIEEVAANGIYQAQTHREAMSLVDRLKGICTILDQKVGVPPEYLEIMKSYLERANQVNDKCYANDSGD